MDRVGHYMVDCNRSGRVVICLWVHVTSFRRAPAGKSATTVADFRNRRIELQLSAHLLFELEARRQIHLKTSQLQ